MRRIITLLFVATLVAASCTPTTTKIGSDDPGAITPPPDPTEAAEPEPEPDSDGFDDPSAGPDRSPAEPRRVPPLVLPATAPGTD
jgi:hypothetical protein